MKKLRGNAFLLWVFFTLSLSLSLPFCTHAEPAGTPFISRGEGIFQTEIAGCTSRRGIAWHRFAVVFLSHASNASLTHCILPSNLCGKKESRSHCSAFFQSSLENACCELVFLFQLCFLSSVERCAAPRRWLWHIATHNALLNRLSHSILKFLTHPPRPGGIARHRFAVVFLSHASNASLTHCILPSNLCGKKESRSHCSAFFQSSLENGHFLWFSLFQFCLFCFQSPLCPKKLSQKFEPRSALFAEKKKSRSRVSSRQNARVRR